MQRVLAGALVVAFISLAMTSHSQVRAPDEREGIATFSTRVSGGVDLTLQPAVRPLFSAFTYGTALTAWVPIQGVPLIAPAARVGYHLLPIQADSSISSVSVGLGATLAAHPGRLQVTVTGLGGGYFSFFNRAARDPAGMVYGDQSGAAGYLAAGIDVDYLLLPWVSVGAGLGYQTMLGLYEGVSGSLTATVNTDGFRRRVELQRIELTPVFPVLSNHYGRSGLGEATLVNEERFPVSNVTVSLFAPDFMTSPHSVAVAERIEPGQSVPVPMGAIFADRILTRTEGGDVPLELDVRYTLAGQEYESAVGSTLRVHHRNALTWDDDRKAAAFVTAKDPAIIRYASAIAGLVRSQKYRSLNPHFRLAVAIYESLSSAGLNYVVDPNSPAYVDASANTQIVDFLQFPRQTFDYRGGDCDDLSILYCSLLESVGVPAAFVTTPGHIFSAFSLGIPVTEARRLFPDQGVILEIDSVAWVPVETTMVGASFTEAWHAGASQCSASPDTVAFHEVARAWELYPPSGYPADHSPDLAIDIPAPDLIALESSYDTSIRRIVQKQLLPRVRAIEEQIASSASPERYLNRLGVLYAQYGLNVEARDAFERALAITEYVPALVNLGNLALLANEATRALTYYERASLTRPDEPSVLLGLARANYELERFAQARAHFSALDDVAPSVGERFGYLAAASQDASGSRASAVELARDTMYWAEED